ncbi:heavy metal-associated isoprenylated plant protein 16-like [Pyrus communis]|uniref:heavy metal-associated isoprenylated plant protein 16-like n=1 Tax=Pyrus communis TaxID=23211 RepID=UPI0035C18A8A
MKQKVVIKLSVHDERTKAKAMKTAVGVDGVNSASYQHDKQQIEVTGEGVDVVVLTTSLRKSLKYADVLSVIPVEEKKKEEKKEECAMGYPQYVVAYPWYEEPASICTIL